MSETTKTIHDVVVQIYPPNEETGYVGQVCEGKFCLEDNVVQLVGPDGTAVKGYSQAVGPGDNPLIIARRLTKRFYFARRGGKNLKGFDGPIPYKPLPKWM